MEKRVCLFTGASGKLGTAFCRAHADKYDIAAIYRRRPPSVPTQRQWQVDPLQPAVALGQPRAFAIQADLTVDREIERVVELVLARFDRVDLLVNAAVHSIWAPMLTSPKLLDSVGAQLQTNFVAPLKLSVALARACWRDQDRENRAANRNIVNISSTAGVKIYRNLNQSIYSASKAALNFLSRHMADEFATIGVRVNALAPNTFPRIVPTDSVVDAIIKLDAGDMTGKILVLDRDGEHLT
jgi:NAD(P)-dependent dehydrogenase (short-subunit alcohol dehydrogenase family)